MIDLLFGGTISGSTITGATSVVSQAISVSDWGGVVGHPGYRTPSIPLLGQVGTYMPTRPKLAARPLTLTITVTDRDASGTITSPDGNCGELADNQDTLLGLIDGAGEGFLVVREMPDGSRRWLRAYCVGGGTFQQGPLFAAQAPLFTIIASCVAPYPLWRSETEYSDTMSGSDTLTRQGGNGIVADATYTFAGDGSLTNAYYGDVMTIDGSSGAVTVDTYARTVSEAGTLEVDTDEWMWLQPATSVPLVASGTTVGVTWREAFI